MNKKIIWTVILMSFMTSIMAIPAPPYPIKVKQPNGKEVTIWLKGDERISWRESLDGYTLLQNKQGYITYAVMTKSGKLKPSKFKVTEIEERDEKTTKFLESIEKNLFWKNKDTD